MAADLYRNRDFISDFDEIVAETAARSREVGRSALVRRTMSYGVGPRESMDIFFPAQQRRGAPLHVFIHGGYWRAGSKEDHWLVAAPVLEAGGIACLLTYALMPGTRLGAIVGQVRAALNKLVAMAPEWGADAGRLSISGHSAGAHLASYLASVAPGDDTEPQLPAVKSMLLVSGIYDLRDIPDSFLKDETGMTPEEARAWSPLSSRHLNGPRRILVASERDTPPFHQQGSELAARLVKAGHDAEWQVVKNYNHMTIVLDMGNPNGTLGRRIAELVQA